jgi:hypothetical protein
MNIISVGTVRSSLDGGGEGNDGDLELIYDAMADSRTYLARGQGHGHLLQGHQGVRQGLTMRTGLWRGSTRPAAIAT